MIELSELKERLIKEYDLQVEDTCRSSSLSKAGSIMMKLSLKMMEEPEKVAKIEENVGNGEEFRIYFSDEESLKELMKLHDEDVDKFYRILRKEELFLNTCLQTFGFRNVLISLDPNQLLSDFNFGEDDFED